MPERIKLTKEILYAVNEQGLTTEQILDDFDIVSNLGVEPRKLIQEWKKKAEKYDGLTHFSNKQTETIHEQIVEHKQLKEDLENTINQLDLRNSSLDNLNTEWKNQKLLTLEAEGLCRALRSDYNELSEKELAHSHILQQKLEKIEYEINRVLENVKVPIVSESCETTIKKLYNQLKEILNEKQ